MNSEVVLQSLPVSIYLTTCEIKNDDFKILDFKLIKNTHFTDYSEDELKNIDILIKAFDKEELKKYVEVVKHLPEHGVFNITYKFRNKNGKIFYFKDYLRLLEKKDNIFKLLGVVTDISNEFQLSEIFNSIYNSPLMGILIYKEKIVLADEVLKKMFEIDDEIYAFSPLDLIPSKYKHEVEPYFKKRLKGEKFSKYYTLELTTFKNKRFYAELFADTIFYDGGYAGFVIFLDKSKFYRHNLFLKLLVEIDEIIASEKDENKLIDKVEQKFKEIGYFSLIKRNEKLNSREIEINNDLKNSLYQSYFYLPIEVDNQLLLSFSFYSKYREDFTREVVSVLKDIQKKLALALKNIKIYKTLIILKKAIDKSYQWIVISDEKGNIIYANDAVEEISGYKKDDLIGKTPNIFKSGKHDEKFYKNLWNTILNGEVFSGIIVNKDKNGRLFYLKDRIIPVKIGNDLYFVSLGIDITKEKMLEEEISEVMYKDKLTGLYNREGFLIEGEKRIENGRQFALLIIDIEDFKLINEIKGHKYGDLILQEFAKFLKDIFYSNDLIARIGNDDFVVLLEYKDIKMLSSILDRFLEKINERKEELPINVKIGVSLYPKDANTLQELIEKAYIALKFAKEEKSTFKFYNEAIYFEVEKYINVKEIVSHAFTHKEFDFYYQPYFDSNNLQNIAGFESLLRIRRNDEIITPNVFIDYLEKSGIIKEVEILMIEKLVEVIKKFKFPFSFNLSGVSLKDENHIKELINLSQEFAPFITIEITERELIEDLELTKKILELFRSKNYKIAIDDFGTGYSSLSYISNLPLDILKIDLSFVRDIDKNEKNLIIVETIINFAKKLKLKTIAEGVESKKQVDILKNLGCDYLQGYYFAKPMPLEKIENILKEKR